MKGICTRALTAASVAALLVGFGCSGNQTAAKAPMNRTVKVTKTTITETPPAVVVVPVAVESCSVPAESHAFFAFAKYDLNKLDEPELADIAYCLTQGPLRQATVTLTGHADPKGSGPFNMKLGTERADTVAKYLEDHGVDSSRITVKSDGKAGASSDPADWPYDRRVDIVVSSSSMRGITQ